MEELPITDLLLGIDVGTTAAKASLFDLRGQLVASAASEYPTQYLANNAVEQDPEDWWNAVCQSVRSLFEESKDRSNRIAAIGVSAQAPTLLAVDQSGVPVRPALIWMDRRSGQQSQDLSERFGFENIVQRTGNRPDPFFVASKLRWMSEHESSLIKKSRWFLQINGFINHRLTGEFSLDVVHRSLLQLHDPSSNGWCDDILEWCGVESDLFPVTSAGSDVIGTVNRSAAEATGLRIGAPVVCGTVDGAAAALEAGVYDPGMAAEMTGTSTVLIMPTSTIRPHPAFISMPHAIPERSLVLAAMVSTGACLKWFRDELGSLEKQEAAKTGKDVYDLLTAEAATSSPGAEGVFFLPYMMGERSPLWHTQARGVFFGLSLASRKADILRSILEGTAFALRQNIEKAREAGLAINTVRSVGGGARSSLWCRIKADVLGLPIEVVKDSGGAPFGAALLAGIGCGLISDPAEFLREVVDVEETYEPNLRLADGYSQRYHHFCNLYTSLKERYDDAAVLPPFGN